MHHNITRLAPMEKADVILNRSKQREYFYEICLKLFAVCDDRGLRLIMENPYAAQHFLVGNFPYKAALVDYNRTRRGDYYNKPTQYWFLNCANTVGASLSNAERHKTITRSARGKKAGLCSEDRSLISPDYARNFICDFILGKEQPNTIPTLF